MFDEDKSCVWAAHLGCVPLTLDFPFALPCRLLPQRVQTVWNKNWKLKRLLANSLPFRRRDRKHHPKLSKGCRGWKSHASNVAQVAHSLSQTLNCGQNTGNDLPFLRLCLTQSEWAGEVPCWLICSLVSHCWLHKLSFWESLRVQQLLGS